MHPWWAEESFKNITTILLSPNLWTVVYILIWIQSIQALNGHYVSSAAVQLWIAEDCWIQTRFYMQDGELRDSEPFCFSVLVGHGQSFCYSVELGSELVLWEKAFQRAVFMEVQRVRVSAGLQTYRKPGTDHCSRGCIALFLLLNVYRVFDNVLSLTIFYFLCQNISKRHFRVLEGAVVNEMVWWISLCAIRTTFLIFLFCYLIFWTFFLRTENLCFWLNKYVIFFFSLYLII